jgi:hypothetical protein
MCQCTRKTKGKTKKIKSSILGIFNILQYYFQCFLVLSPLSPITP